MENSVLTVFAIIGVCLCSCFVPLVGLIAVAWAAVAWLHVYAALVISLFYCRFGGPLLVWPSWPPIPQPEEDDYRAFQE